MNLSCHSNHNRTVSWCFFDSFFFRVPLSRDRIFARFSKKSNCICPFIGWSNFFWSCSCRVRYKTEQFQTEVTLLSNSHMLILDLSSMMSTVSQSQIRAPSLAIIVIYLKYILNQLSKYQLTLQKSIESPMFGMVTASTPSNKNLPNGSTPQEPRSHSFLTFDIPVCVLFCCILLILFL